MHRWSVKWETPPASRPAEIARIKAIDPDCPDHLAAIFAAEKSRSFRLKPHAIEHIQHLKKNRQAIAIRLYQIEPWKLHQVWHLPSSPLTDQPLTIDHSMKSNITPESEFASSSNRPITLIDGLLPQDTFTFRGYQRDDMARAAMHDGAVIGWDPGMGKTMVIFTMPFLKQARYALIVAPAGLHEQIIDEGRTKFGVEVTPIRNQEAALEMMRQGILPLPGHQSPVTGHQEQSSSLLTAPPLPDDSAPRFFITSYTWLGYNQADEWASGDDETNEFIRLRRLQILMSALTFDDSAQATAIAAAAWKTGDRITDWQALSIPENSPPGRIRSALHTAARIWHPTLHPGDSTVHWRWHRITTAARDLLHLSDTAERKLLAEIDSHPALGEAADTLATIEENIGHIRYYDDAPDHPVKCVFRPTLASLLCHVFDFVVCDEAVRLKSGTSYQAQGVLRMTPRCRYALTGTPIKNKLPDFFFLASWVTGHHRLATARWPYGNDTPDRGQFSRDFGVLEENLTAMEKAVRNGKKAPPPKTTNHICNVHRLWRILGPVVIRRRKDDAGADCQIVDKTIHPIRVMPGTRQKKIYGFHLRSAPPKRSILASIGAQLQNLRQAALNPCSNKLTHGGKNGRSDSPWTPKYAAILQLAIDLLPQGEQLVIFSPFQDFSRSLAARFRDAGIRHLVLDGNTTPEKRGSAIKEFKSGAAAVLIAGIDSMGEGHSLDCCRHLVLPSLSWAFDSNTQAVERVHRLTSRKDVSIYVILTTGTIDVRLASIWQEKGDSSDLALDGRLTEKHHEEVDLGKLLRDAVKEFDPKADSIDEDEVRAQWNSTLLPALTAAGKAYITKRQTTTATTPDTTTRPAPAAPAPVANRPRSLFDLMKNNNRPTPQPTPQAPTQPNIIPFPGMLGRPKLAGTSSARPSQEHPVPAPAKPAYSMPRVNIAELLRQSTAKR